jgi:hypothetical protein
LQKDEGEDHCPRTDTSPRMVRKWGGKRIAPKQRTLRRPPPPTPAAPPPPGGEGSPF